MIFKSYILLLLFFSLDNLRSNTCWISIPSNSFNMVANSIWMKNSKNFSSYPAISNNIYVLSYRYSHFYFVFLSFFPSFFCSVCCLNWISLSILFLFRNNSFFCWIKNKINQETKENKSFSDIRIIYLFSWV